MRATSSPSPTISSRSKQKLKIGLARTTPSSADADAEAQEARRRRLSCQRASASTARAEQAPAKVNLTLRVLGRRADGYHELESLVVFAGVADRFDVRARAARWRSPCAGRPRARRRRLADNLVLKAARALAERIAGLTLGRFALTKRLPVAAGLGGGSADAAAALRLLARPTGSRATIRG